MANNFLTAQMIANEALMVLENNLTFTKFVNRQYDKQFKNAEMKIGNTFYARKPVRYIGRDGAALSTEDSTETQVPIVLNQQSGVDIKFTSVDRALNIRNFSEQFLKPAVANIANKIDYRGLALVGGVWNQVGTPGTTPGSGMTAQQTTQLYLNAGALLDKTATPRDGMRSVVINEDAQASTVGALSGLLNPVDKISEQYNKGTLGTGLGLKFSMDQNVNVMTTGSAAGAPKVNGAAQGLIAPQGLTLGTISNFNFNTKGWTASTAVLNAGDIFTIANVYGVNPQSRQSTNKLQQFVVGGAMGTVYTSDGAGNLLVPITPAPIATGAYQNVTVLPADSANLTVVGPASTVSPLNVAFHRDAFTLACVDLPLPEGVDFAARASDDQLGISIRVVRAYDINTDSFPCRLDVLYGWAALRPELACRIAG